MAITSEQLRQGIEREMKAVLDFSGQHEAPDVSRLKAFARQVAFRVAIDHGVLDAYNAAQARRDKAAADEANRRHREWCSHTGATY